MEDITKAIEATKKIILRQIQDNNIYVVEKMFSEYSSSYAFTNENINGYISEFNFQGKNNALSVLASGDHSFNLVYNGIYDIDTFDTNKLSEFFVLGVKRTAILTFKYKDFLAFMFEIMDDNTSLDDLTTMISDLTLFMEKRYAYYWREVISFNYKLQKDNPRPLNLFQMLLVNTIPPTLNTLKNTYLIDEEHYNRLRNSLGKTNITFTSADALDISEIFKRKYDFILLSNIADYFHKRFGWEFGYEFLKTEMSKLKTLLHDDGVLAIAYLMNYIWHDACKDKLISGSGITKEDLINEEIIVFPDVYYNQVSTIAKDALLLERKKKNK